MNSECEIRQLAQILRANGDKILSSEFKLKLSVSLLTTLNEFFQRYPSSSTSGDNVFQILKGNSLNPDIQLIHDFIQKTVVLCLNCFPNDPQNTILNISKFKNLKCLEIQKISVTKIEGIQPFRTQLEQIKLSQCLNSIQEIIQSCGADNSSSFPWNHLVKMDLSFNNLERIDDSLEFVQNLRYLNISHNKLSNVECLNVLPNLIVLDLSFNRLTRIPSFHVKAASNIEKINLNQNLIETLAGMGKLEGLNELNLANNCFMDHKDIAPLSILQSLRCLNFVGNPLSFHPKHRQLASSNLHINAANEKFMLNGLELTKKEKANCGQVILNSYHHIITSGSANNISNSLTDSMSSFKISKNEKQRKKRSSRLIDIDKDVKNTNDSSDTSISAITPNDNDHLITKKHIESLRQQYGADWLTKSDRGANKAIKQDITDNIFDKPELFGYQTVEEELVKDFACNPTNDEVMLSSTPINNNFTNNSSVTTSCSTSTDVKLNEDISATPDTKQDIFLDKIYKHSETDDNISESIHEDKDITDHLFMYNVINKTNSKDILLLVSDVSIQEKNSFSGSTLSKWNLTILESCDRMKSNTLRINFDTLRRDKQERIYIFKDDQQCSELEKYLRNMLSVRSLCEMNQQIYKCLNCSCQFTVEKKMGRTQNEICCPECKSLFLCEQKDYTKNLVILDTVTKEESPPHDSDVEVISNSNSSRSSSVEVLLEDKISCAILDDGIAIEADELTKNSIFDTIIQSTNKLMSKSNNASNLNLDTGSAKYKFNYVDFSDVDHRLKFHFYQTMFQDNNEQFKWIVKTKLFIESTNKFVESGVIVMSTSKLYLMQIFSLDYAEDVSKWMRQLQIVPVENIDIVEMLPYNVGLCFHLKSFGKIVLILQDFLRCESLINFLVKRKELPLECRLYREESRLKLTHGNDKCDIEMLTVVNNVTVITDTSTTNFDTTVLYITEDNLFLTDPVIDLLWLLPKSYCNIGSNVASQNLSNLIEIKNLNDNRFSLCFLEETLNKVEVWDCMFETKGSMEYCLQKIDTHWSALFGVSLLSN